MRRAALCLAGLLAACAGPVTEGPADRAALRIGGLQHWQGAQAKQQADALCRSGGVRTSIYDRYEAGAWVFVEGCA